MNKCLQIIKKKVPEKFVDQTENNFWSDSIRINFVSATLNSKVENLGSKLMRTYEKVGFDLANLNEDAKATIP